MRFEALLILLVIVSTGNADPYSECDCWSWDMLLPTGICGAGTGGDSKWFPNICEFRKFNCKALINGAINIPLRLVSSSACPDCDVNCLSESFFPEWPVPETIDDCDRTCPEGLLPVCATDTMTDFPSDCHFEKHICEQYMSGHPVYPNMVYGSCYFNSRK